LTFSGSNRTPEGLNEGDVSIEEFPTSARILYDGSAPRFLDMESLAALGGILADHLSMILERRNWRRITRID
jgi:hypothetical protein